MDRQTIIENNNKRKIELEDIITSLEKRQIVLREKLSETNNKLEDENKKFAKLSSLSTSLRNKKIDTLQDFLIWTIIILCSTVVYCFSTISIIYFILVGLYILKIPSYIKLYKILKNKEIEHLDENKESIKEKIENLSYNKTVLEKELRNTYYKCEDMIVERQVLEDISLYYGEKEKPKDKNITRTRKNLNKI